MSSEVRTTTEARKRRGKEEREKQWEAESASLFSAGSQKKVTGDTAFAHNKERRTSVSALILYDIVGQKKGIKNLVPKWNT